MLAFSSRLGGRDGLSEAACGTHVRSSFLFGREAAMVSCDSKNAVEAGTRVCCPDMSLVCMSVLIVVG
jgi:hypothetical protein